MNLLLMLLACPGVIELAVTDKTDEVDTEAPLPDSLPDSLPAPTDSSVEDEPPTTLTSLRCGGVPDDPTVASALTVTMAPAPEPGEPLQLTLWSHYSDAYWSFTADTEPGTRDVWEVGTQARVLNGGIVVSCEWVPEVQDFRFNEFRLTVW